ncbi:MAG: glutathione peroxidase [Bacteroidales bacterium]|nr:glutathione peroxidase [Bacteroidales bacterium]
MKRFFLTFVCMAAVMMTATAQSSVFDFSVKTQDGKMVKLDSYKGQYILIVNTATQCGFTPQYEEMQHMYEKFKDDGFVILDFPCNQFGEQAPGSNQEIHNFCTSTFNITFPQFAKVNVNGPDEDPLFTWLKKQKGFEGFDQSNPIGKHLHEAFLKQDPNYAENPDIKWNFTKFLIDREGNVVARFEPTVDMNKVADAIYRTIYK